MVPLTHVMATGTLLNVAALAAVLALTAATARSAQAQPNVEELMARVGERVAEFYNRAKNVICIETSTVQPVDFNYSVVGFARTVESELRLEAADEFFGEATLVRQIRKVNGRPVRDKDKDKKDRQGCTDPNPLSAEPLAFLLPDQRSKYQFRITGTGRDQEQPTLVIEFDSVDRRSNLVLIKDPGGHDDCFDWSGPIASRGRIWVDASTYDVRRVEKGQRGPVDVKVPALIQQEHHLENWVVIVRDDVTIRYKSVAFREPDEVLLLPESIDSFTVIRGGLQSTRRNHTFSDYRRFVTEGKVVR